MLLMPALSEFHELIINIAEEAMWLMRLLISSNVTLLAWSKAGAPSSMHMRRCHGGVLPGWNLD